MVIFYFEKTKLNHIIPIRTSPKTTRFRKVESKRKEKMKISAKKSNNNRYVYLASIMYQVQS